MFNKAKAALVLVLLSIFIGGCATIISGGSTQELNIDSNPKGAKIFVGNYVSGEVANLIDTGFVTPHAVPVSRKDGVVILKKEGYKDTNVALFKTVNGWFFGNIILGGAIGMSIDSSTGAINKYDPDNFFLELEKE